MKPDAKNTVACKSKDQAEIYLRNGNFGRAFAHFLVVLKLVPEWKNELRVDFSSALCTWGKQLESQGRFQDLFNCYEQALEIFPENEEVYSNLGAHLFRLGHLQEAAHYFRKALEINSNYLPSFRNLQSVCNSLVERWHFRMLNDSHRNDAYREAIMKKIRQGFTSILDIGTGTGLLSLYAVTSGAKHVYACDYSPTMYSIAQDVFKANKVEDKVTLINKLSNNLSIPEDLPQRLSLVVTETMDSGLLGEHLLQTLLHAWDQLLKPACPQLLSQLECEVPLIDHGVVLPFGARLWAVPIHCPSVARCNYLTDVGNFTSVWLHSDFSEPYDTENLRNLKDCKFLCDPVEVLTFDFNDPSLLKAYFDGEKGGKKIDFQFEGSSDALAVWFDVLLDEDITVSSSPFSENENCCWDQAVFKFKRPLDSVNVQVKCANGKLEFDFCADVGVTAKLDNISEIPVSIEMISFLNNKKLQDAIFSLTENFDSVKTILDLSPFPLLGLRLLQVNNANVTCVVKTVEETKAVEEFVKNNTLKSANVKCLEESKWSELYEDCCDQYDLIFCNIFDKTGELKESSISSIPQLLKLLSPGGSIVPQSVTAVCQLIDCEWIRRTSRVIDEELIQTLKIAEFINIYQVSQQLDVDLKNTSLVVLSEVTECLQLCVSDLATDSCLDKDVVVTAVRDGRVTGVALWYHYELSAGSHQLSTLGRDSHVNQVVFLVDPPAEVKAGEQVVLKITYQFGIFRIKLVH